MTKHRCRIALLTLIVAAAAVPGVAASAQAVAPSAAKPAADAIINGFRSARWGMTEPELRRAIVADFGVSDAAIGFTFNQLQQTRILVLDLVALEPGPGPVRITYVLGATSQRLIHVNVVWTLADPTPPERERLAAAAQALADYFRARPEQPARAAPPQILGPNSTALYIGADSLGAAMAVEVAGIAFAQTDLTTGKQVASPEPTGPAVLKLIYMANVAKPDIKEISPSAF